MRFSNDQLESFKSFRFAKLMDYLRNRELLGTGDGDRFKSAKDLQVRLRATRSLGFGPRDIDSVELVDLPNGRQMLDVRVNFLGLYGPSSPLPPAYTEWVLHDHRDIIPIEDFLDFFNHTLIYDVDVIWRKYRHELRYRSGALDPLSRRETALLGLPPQFEPSANLPERRLLLPQIGLAAMYSRSADTVAAMIAHYFAVPAKIAEFVKRVFELPDDQRTSLGEGRSDLGDTFVLGSELADYSGKFSLYLGPLDAEQFAAFLPGGKFHALLITYVAFLVRDPLEWDMHLALEDSAVAGWQLGAAQLGWSTWLEADANERCVMSLDPWPGYVPENGLETRDDAG